MTQLYESRVSSLKYIHGTDIDFLMQKSALEIVIRLLPENVFWVNTMGASFNPNNNIGLISRAYVRLFPSFIVLAKTAYIDGSYLNEQHLEACSPAYNLIINPNPEKATQILLKSIRRNRKVIFDKYFTTQFIAHMPYILEHTFVGHNKNGTITGVHYQTSDVRLKRPIKSNFDSITPYFLIDKVDPLTDEVLSKNAPSTFWPTEWDIERCIVECSIAWENKSLHSPDVYNGYTSNGLKVKFCFRGERLATVYPDQSNNNSE